jgi:hypothetical protein
VGVEKRENMYQGAHFPLPFIPSHQGRGSKRPDRLTDGILEE